MKEQNIAFGIAVILFVGLIAFTVGGIIKQAQLEAHEQTECKAFGSSYALVQDYKSSADRCVDTNGNTKYLQD